MSKLRFRSTAAPFHDPESAGRAANLLAMAEAMGVWEPKEVVSELDGAVFEEALSSLAAVGIAAGAPIEWKARAAHDGEGFAAWLSSLTDAVYSSPVPDLELPRLGSLFGVERLADLAGVSPSSMRRYASARRQVPDDVADHAHVVTRIVCALAGSYNERGIRRWFERPRSQLGGRTPEEVLRHAWEKGDGEEAGSVVALAEALVG